MLIRLIKVQKCSSHMISIGCISLMLLATFSLVTDEIKYRSV